MRPCLRKLCVIHPARLGPSRGSWVCVDEDGPCWGPFEPRRKLQAGKSGDPRSQNADSSPWAQGALGLGFEAKPKVKYGAPRAPKACGLGRRVAVDWTWASPLPHVASATARLDKSLRHARETIITCDRGRRRLAFSCYKWGGGGATVAHLFLVCLLLPPRSTADNNGAYQKVFCRREREVSP